MPTEMLLQPPLTTSHGFLDAAVVKREFGRPLILGLEILVAADIIKTITVDPSLESVGVLGLLVLVRTVLSFSLDVEVEGFRSSLWSCAGRRKGVPVCSGG